MSNHQQNAHEMHKKDVVEAKCEKNSTRNAVKAKANEELDKVSVCLDVLAVEAALVSNATLDLELAWFRCIDKEVPVKSKLGNKNLKKEALLRAIECHMPVLHHAPRNDHCDHPNSECVT